MGSAIIEDKQKEKFSEISVTLRMSLTKNTNLNDRFLTTPATDHLLNKNTVSTNTLVYHISALLENILKFGRELTLKIWTMLRLTGLEVFPICSEINESIEWVTGLNVRMSSMHFAMTSFITATIADAISSVQPLRKLVLSGADGR